MMNLIRKLIAGEERQEDPEVIRRREEGLRALHRERGEFRQSLERLRARNDLMERTGLVLSWESASRMLKEKGYDQEPS